MKLLTRQDLIDRVAWRWKDTYFEPGEGWKNIISGSSEQIYLNLFNLKNPTEADVKAVVGNGSWTDLRCDCCKLPVTTVCIVPIGSDRSTYMCQNCLRTAWGLFNEPTN